MSDDVSRRLLATAQRLLDGRTVGAALRETREVIGSAALPFGEHDAQAALDKLRDGWESPTAQEWIALKVVVQLMRPAVYTNGGGRFDPLPPYGSRDADLAERWAQLRPWSARLSICVGRIDDRAGHVGTGFLVAADLVVTNRHVLDVLTFGTGRLAPGVGTVGFGFEYDTPSDERPVPLVEVVATHERLDVVILRIDGARPHWLELAATAAGAEETVVAVGYPGRTEPSPVHAQVFANVYGFRRASPGVVRAAAPDLLEHDCSTIGGSSGSPLLALPGGAVVGVHYGGLSGYANNAVPVAHLAELLAAVGGAP